MRSLKRITTITVLPMIALIFSGMFSVASARSKAHCQRAILFYGCGTDNLDEPDRSYMKVGVIAKTIAGKRKVTVRMKTKAAKTGGSSYEIRYRVKGSSGWKTVTTGKQSVTIRKLKKGKKYQIQCRAFRKAGGVTYRGPWSKAKTAKV